MSKKQKTRAWLGALAILVGIVAVFAFRGAGDVSVASADDANRTTSLSISGGKATALMTTTDALDDEWVITFSWNDGSGAVFVSEVGSSTPLGWSTGNCDGSITLGNFSSADTVTARFRTFDQYGSTRFDFSRSVAIP